MRQPSYSGQFRRDLKRIKKRGKDVTKLKVSMQLLIEASPLPEQYLDHLLKGDWKDCRDLHIEPDWLLIYRVKDGSVHFERTGTHSDLFD